MSTVDRRVRALEIVIQHGGYFAPASSCLGRPALLQSDSALPYVTWWYRECQSQGLTDTEVSDDHIKNLLWAKFWSVGAKEFSEDEWLLVGRRDIE